MYVTNVTRGPVSLDGVHTLKPTDQRIYYADTADNIERAIRLVKAKQISVGFDDSLLAIASEHVSGNTMLHIAEQEDGVLYCRRAFDGSMNSVAHGFSTTAYPTGEVVRVYLEGFLEYKNNLTKNSVYYLGAGPGSITTTAPTAEGRIRQVVGVAVTTDLLLFMNNGYDLVVGSGPVIPGANVNIRFVKHKKVLAADNDTSLTLNDTPAANSEHVYWNGVLVDEYAVTSNVVDLQASLNVQKGDTFIVKYAVVDAVPDTGTT